MTRRPSLRLSLILVALAALLAVPSCKRSAAPQVKVLPSGRDVTITKLKLGHLEGGGKGLFVVYESELPFDDKRKVSAELMEVWDAMKGNALRDPDIRYASITAQSKPKGFVVASQDSIEVILHKQKDGGWGPKRGS